MKQPPPVEPAGAPRNGPSCVMLLSLWACPPAPWHARLVGTDAQVHEFGSPFELARYVARLSAPGPAADPSPAGGLR
jgi:hypothetical protein